MGIKEKISKTIADKELKRPKNADKLITVLTPEGIMDIPSPAPVKDVEKKYCQRCEANTESWSNSQGAEFCHICGLARKPIV